MQSFDAATLAKEYRDGKLTPADVVDQVFARIAARGDDAVWIALAARERVLDDARALQKRRDAGERLPLYGLPFAVKDNIDVAGLPTTAACPGFAYRGTRARRRAPDRGGGAADRKDEPRSVRDRPRRRSIAVRDPAQPVRRTLHRRRLQLGLGGQRRGR